MDQAEAQPSDNPYHVAEVSEEETPLSESAWSAALVIASSVKVEFWGVVLTVVTILAMYATLLALFTFGRLNQWDEKLILPFLLGIVGGQAICLTARVSCFSACRHLRLTPHWMLAVSSLAAGELIIAINALQPIVLMTQLLGIVLLFLAQPLMVYVWLRIASRFDIQSVQGIGRGLFLLFLSILVLMAAPRLLEDRIPAMIDWVAAPILALILIMIGLYVRLLTRLRRDLYLLELSSKVRSTNGSDETTIEDVECNS